MKVQSPRAVVAKFFDAVNNHEIQADTPDLFTENVELEGPGRVRLKGREQVAAFFHAYWEAFPDANSETDEMIVSGSSVVTEGTFTGTHRGVLRAEGLDLQPSGARIEIRHLHHITVRRGRINEIHFYMDRLDLQQQLRAAA